MSAIYLIRHGQANFGSADYDRLSPLGIEQARIVGESLRSRVPLVHTAVCGNMQRQTHTARVCLDAMGFPEQTLLGDGGFDEYDHADIVDRFMDRKAMGEALNSASDRMRAFEDLFSQGMTRWQSGSYDGEYRETWSVYRDRCLAALDRVEASLSGSQTALVFTSGGVIAAIAQSLLEFPQSRYAPFNWRLANAGVSKIVCGRSGRFLATLNEHGHFEGAQAKFLTYR